jgi:site-specific recombinase XerD
MSNWPPEVVEWLRWKSLGGLSKMSVRNYGGILAGLSHWLNTNYGIGLIDATQGHLEAWRYSLTVCDSSVAVYMVAVRGFYRWARRRGLRASDPAEEIPVPKRKRGVPHPIAEDELELAIQSAPRRIRPWLALEGYQGFRCMSVAYLERHDVHNTQQPPMIDVNPRGAKGGHAYTMPLHPLVWDELVAYGIPARGYWFKRYDGQPGPNSPALISNLINDYLRSLDIHERAHGCRHRFGTISLQRTHDFNAVKALMGHQSIASTQIYTDLCDEDALAALMAVQPPKRRGLRAVEGD